MPSGQGTGECDSRPRERHSQHSLCGFALCIGMPLFLWLGGQLGLVLVLVLVLACCCQPATAHLKHRC
jgi:hypothetical protein